MFEKADLVGGTTAWSGGQVWIPNNPHMAEVGTSDDREQAITYIMSLSRGLLDRELVEAYVDAGPEMVEFLEARTPVQFYAVPGMPDYHPSSRAASPRAGARSSARSTRSTTSASGPHRVTPSPYFSNPHITMSETPLGKAIPDPPTRGRARAPAGRTTSAAAARRWSGGCCAPASTAASSREPVRPHAS